MAAHALVLIKASNCGYCIDLEKRWPSFLESLKSSGIHLSVHEVNLPSTRSEIDTNQHPAGLRVFQQWYPNLILIPASLWSRATAELGPANKVSFVDEAAVFNGELVQGALRMKKEVQPLSKESFTAWVKEVLQLPQFRAGAPIVGEGGIRPLVPGMAKFQREEGSAAYGRHNGARRYDVCGMRLTPKNR
jgi:hypothetical protein